MGKENKVASKENSGGADVLDAPETPQKFDIEGWNTAVDEPAEKQIDANAAGTNEPADDNADDSARDLAMLKELDLDGSEESKEEKSKETTGAADDGVGMDPDNLLKQMAGDEDNEFSLDDEGESAAGADDKGKEGDTKQIDGAVLSRIAKEIGVDEVQDAEQLIASIKNRIAIAETGATAPTASIDSVIGMQDRDLLLEALVRRDGMTRDDADEFIDKNIRIYGEEWVETQTLPIRSQLKNTRQAIVEDHTKKMQDKLRLESKFADVAVEEFKNLKTIFGIPLKPYLPKLKEFQAKLKNPTSVAQMRSDARSWVAGAFISEYGEQIFNSFLKEKLGKKYREGFQHSTKQNVYDKILNKGPVRSSTELPMSGDKGGNFSINAWNDSSSDGE